MRKAAMGLAAMLLLAFAASAQPAPLAPGAHGAEQNAADPARLAAARRVLILTGAARNMETIITAFVPDFLHALGSAQGDLPEDVDVVSALVQEEMRASLDDYMEMAARVYARRFSAQELNAIADFFESPAGRAYTAQSPEMIREFGQLGEVWGRTIVAPRLRARIAALQAQGQMHKP